MKTISLWKLPLAIGLTCYLGLIVSLLSGQIIFPFWIWISPPWIASIVVLLLILFSYEYLPYEDRKDRKIAVLLSALFSISSYCIAQFMKMIVSHNWIYLLLGTLLGTSIVVIVAIGRKHTKLSLSSYLARTSTIMCMQILFDLIFFGLFFLLKDIRTALVFGSMGCAVVGVFIITCMIHFLDLLFPDFDYSRH